MSEELKNNQNEAVISFINDNIHQQDFAKYMNYCVEKWKRLVVELQIIDAIILSICKQWHISKEELMEDKDLSEPRSIMYYIIKKEVKLSYAEIGELFSKQKSYIHKVINDITFLVEEHGHKNMVSIVTNIRKEISYPPIPDSVKNT